MINQETLLTFINLGLSVTDLYNGLVKLIRNNRPRVIGAVRVEQKLEDTTNLTYCIMLQSSVAGANSAVVYYLSFDPTKNGVLNSQIQDFLSKNQIKLFDSPPDPPKTVREKERLGTNYDLLEKKIKEFSGQF